MTSLPAWFPDSVSPHDLDALVDVVARESFGDGSFSELRELGFYSPRYIQDLVWFLTERQLLDAGSHPQTWQYLVPGASRVEPWVVAEFLSGVDCLDVIPDDYDGPLSTDESFAGESHYAYLSADPDVCVTRKLVPWWPSALDQMVLPAFFDDPTPFLERRETLWEPVRKGLDLVRFRCGDLDRDELLDDVLGGLAETWLDQTLPDWVHTGDQDEWGRGLDYIQLVRSDTWSEQGLRDVVELFGKWREFEEAVLERARQHDGPIPASAAEFAWSVASVEDLANLLARTDIDDVAGAVNALVERRDDSVELLASMANDFADAGRPEHAELLATAALLRAKRNDEPAPEGIEAHVRFALLDRYDWPVHSPAMRLFLRAIGGLSEQRRADWFEELLASDEMPLAAFAATSAVGPGLHIDHRLFERIDRREARGEDGLHFMETTATGLAGLGSDALEWLDEALDTTTSALARDTFRLAAVYVLCDLANAGETWPAEFDGFLTYTQWEHPLFDDTIDDWMDPEEMDGKHFKQLVLDELNEAIAGLPGARAEAVVTGAMDISSPMWTRSLSVISDLETPQAIRAIEYVVDMLEMPPMTLYAAERTGDAAEPNALNRIGGRPVGLTADTWPVVGHDDMFGPDEDEEPWPMDHVCTLDLEDAPELRERIDGQPRALAFFALDPEDFETGDRAEVVLLDDADIERGVYEDELPAGPDDEPRGFRVQAFRAPAAIFDVDAPGDEEALDPVTRELREAVYLLGARLGGGPIWLQDEPTEVRETEPGAFLMQFDSAFVPEERLSLFGHGVMYLFEHVVVAET